MDDKPALPASPPARRWLLWSAAVGVFLLAVAGAGIAIFLGQRPIEPAPLAGDLTVTILRVKGGNITSTRIDEPGALPVRAGDKMHLTARYSEPAFTYLLWLKTDGKVAPLYPWNVDNLELTDADQPPPLTRAAAIVFNPMTLGNGWTFDKQGGLETVLLLARRTPLEDDVRLGSILASVPPVKMRDPGEAAILRRDRKDTAMASLLSLRRGNDDESTKSDRALAEVLEKLSGPFELIRAVRFAHEGN